MSEKCLEIFIDIVAILIILSAAYEAVFTEIPNSTWGVQLGIGVVLMVSPLSKIGENIWAILKNRTRN